MTALALAFGYLRVALEYSAPAVDAQPGAADDDQRRADRRYDRDYGGDW